MPHTPRHARRKGSRDRIRNTALAAPAPDAIARRLRDDPPPTLSAQARWEMDQQRLAREAMEQDR